MAKKTIIKNEIKEKILNYISLLRKSGIDVKQAILFGSFAKGYSSSSSDIDLCVISPQFGKDSFNESVFLARKANEIDPMIEPYPLHPSELKEKFIPLICEIKKYGIRFA